MDAQYAYLRPLDKILNSPTNLWYTKQRMGYNTLKRFIPKFFAASRLEELHTNHSLRTTSITRMFRADVPEKIIPYSGKVWPIDSFRAFGERKFGKLIDQPIDY